MEAAGLMVVVVFRKVVLGLIVFGGDDSSGKEWDSRGWQTKTQIREKLFWLSVEACLSLKINWHRNSAWSVSDEFLLINRNRVFPYDQLPLFGAQPLK
jgi:hypothetical protein